MKANLDEVDIRLLELLQADGRMTNAELAQRVDLSPPSTLQRVRNLERSGLIKGYRALLDPDKLGLKVTVIAMISLALHQDRPIEEFRRAILQMPEVMECHHISGDHDFLLKIVVRDIRAYEELIRERLSKIKGVQKISSSFVLGTPKSTTEYPVS